MSVAATAAGLPADALQRLPSSSRRREIAAFGLLGLAAVLVRTFHWWQTSLMFNDGPTFLQLARMMDAGRWSEALAHPYHPLYPLAVLAAHRVIPDWEQAAVTVSILSGAVAVLCLLVFARSAFGLSAGWIAAIFLAVQPRAVSYSADIQSDGLYLALFLASIACLWSGIVLVRPARAAWSGAFAGLAYLARPEGVGVLVIGAGVAALHVLRRQWTLRKAAGWIGALCAAALLVAAPYLVWLRVEHGQWILSQKKIVSRMLDLDEEAGAPASSSTPEAARAPNSALPPITDASPTTPRPLAAAAAVLRAASSAVRPWFLALLVAGVLAGAGLPRGTGEFVALVVGTYDAVLFAQSYTYGYVDARHALPPLVVAFGYLGVAMPLLGSALARALAWLRRGAMPGPRVATAAGVALVFAAALGQSIKPERAGARADRAAAEWVRVHPLPPGALAASKGRLAYFAERTFVPLPLPTSPGTIASLRSAGVRFVILDDESLARYPELAAAQGTDLRTLQRFEDRGRKTTVYELVEASPVAVPALPAAGVGAP